MVRLAFFIHFDRTWLGGVNVILNLINSLARKESILPKIKIILITNSKKKLKFFFLNRNIEIIEDPNFFNRNIFCKIIDKILLLLIGKTYYLEKFLLKNKINFISHTDIATGINSKSKSIVWIPDFQFLHLGNLFSFRYKCLKRLNIFLFKKHAHKILLSSKSAYNDLKKIINIPKKKIIINSFSFDIPPVKRLKKLSYLRKKYKLKENFFYLPNQYWVHKNHKIVINALKRLKIENKIKNIYIYSTGSKNDYRRPNHFNYLMDIIKKDRLQNNYKYLGTLPYLDVMSLIYHAKAIINPSLFEGWSSTVEQAKAYNKKIILSNINVHIEQKPENAIFFDPKNSKDLSKILMKVCKEKKIKIRNIFTRRNQKKLGLKIEKYEKNYIDMIY